jgi:hypothetical protein
MSTWFLRLKRKSEGSCDEKIIPDLTFLFPLALVFIGCYISGGTIRHLLQVNACILNLLRQAAKVKVQAKGN